jgi:hypothetical protein
LSQHKISESVRRGAISANKDFREGQNLFSWVGKKFSPTIYLTGDIKMLKEIFVG